MSINILLADDHQIVLEGLRALLENDMDMDVVGEASNGREAVSLARKLSPNVVIMDVNMPELNGMEATRQIVADNPDVKVIALSMHADRRYVSEMLKAGAMGYMLKEAASGELIEAIRTVEAGRNYLSPKITDVVVDDYVQQLTRGQEPQADVLTAREKEVLQLLAEGKSIKETAEALHLSEKTVGTHRWQMSKKLGIRTIAALTKYAIREGITSLES